eukprot:1722934-Pleurochrysis_carterae.AAC.1
MSRPCQHGAGSSSMPGKSRGQPPLGWSSAGPSQTAGTPELPAAGTCISSSSSGPAAAPEAMSAPAALLASGDSNQTAGNVDG